MDKKVKGVIALVVVAAAGYFIFMTASWGLFCMKFGERMKDMPRFVTAEQVLALPSQLKGDADHYHVVGAETITVDTMIEARTVQGDMLFYFVVVTVHNGAKLHKDEARIDSPASLIEPDARKRLTDAGVVFKNLPG